MDKAVSGDSASVVLTETQAQDWLESSLPGLLNDYSLENIFNADDTGLFFFKCLPDRTQTFKVLKWKTIKRKTNCFSCSKYDREIMV